MTDKEGCTVKGLLHNSGTRTIVGGNHNLAGDWSYEIGSRETCTGVFGDAECVKKRDSRKVLGGIMELRH